LFGLLAISIPRIDVGYTCNSDRIGYRLKRSRHANSPPQTPPERSDTVTSALSVWGQDMSNTSEMTASPRLRIIFAVAAAVMLSLWAWSLVPPIENWGNPNENGFSYVGVFYTTITCLPVALCLLVGRCRIKPALLPFLPIDSRP